MKSQSLWLYAHAKISLKFMEVFDGRGEFCLHMDFGIEPQLLCPNIIQTSLRSEGAFKGEVEVIKHLTSGWKKDVILLDEINVFCLK